MKEEGCKVYLFVVGVEVMKAVLDPFMDLQYIA